MPTANTKTARKATRAANPAAKKAKTTTASSNAYKGLSPEEIAAMKETLKERKGAASKEEAEKAVLEKIAEMKGLDHALAKRIHEIVKANAPSLSPRTWYGMPAYAKDAASNKGGDIICFFQSASKFKARYATFGFSDKANLDQGAMWPVAFALKELTPADEARITALVKQAVS